MSTTPQRMNEIADRLVAALRGEAEDANFSELWADVVKLWTCYGDDFDQTGKGLSTAVQMDGSGIFERVSMHDVRARVAQDCVVVELVMHATDPEHPDDRVVDPACWIAEVDNGKITRLSVYRDMETHGRLGRIMSSDPGVAASQELLTEVSESLVRVNAVSPLNANLAPADE